MPGMPGIPNQTGFTIGVPGMPNRTSKNREWIISPARDLGPKFWAARAWTHFFHAHEMLFLSANGPFNFVMPKYIKFRLSH